MTIADRVALKVEYNIEQQKRLIALKLIENGLDVKTVADLIDLPIEQIEFFQKN